MIYDNILQVVGNTPVVRFQRIGADLPTELYGKCEFLNPGGSVKDRIAVRMVDGLEKSGRIGDDTTLIEPTSGNTGAGLAMTAAVKGYRLIITMPEKMSQEKQVVMESLGAEIIRTPTEAAHDDPESLLGVAKRLNEEIEDSVIPDQYQNPDNPDAHYHGTAAEIWDDFGDSLDMVVIGAGTGGTITGIGALSEGEEPRRSHHRGGPGRLDPRWPDRSGDVSSRRYRLRLHSRRTGSGPGRSLGLRQRPGQLRDGPSSHP